MWTWTSKLDTNTKTLTSILSPSLVYNNYICWHSCEMQDQVKVDRPRFGVWIGSVKLHHPWTLNGWEQDWCLGRCSWCGHVVKISCCIIHGFLLWSCQVWPKNLSSHHKSLSSSFSQRRSDLLVAASSPHQSSNLLAVLSSSPQRSSDLLVVASSSSHRSSRICSSSLPSTKSQEIRFNWKL